MEIKTKRFRTWHAVLVGILMFSLGLGVSFYGVVSANIQLPDPAFNAGVTRDPEEGVVDPTKISDGPNKPTNPPGGDGNVIPSFSAINLPVITNKNGPVQVSDDLVVHGMTDVQEGIINGKGGDPIQIWDDVEVRGNGVEPGTMALSGDFSTAGNITLDGEISGGNGVVTIAGSLQVKKGADTNFQIDENGLISNPNAGLVTILNRVDIGGSLEVSEDISILRDVSVPFGNFQVVVGTTTLNKLTVSGGETVSNGLTVKSGDTVIDGGLILHDSGKAANLDVSGQAEFKGDVSLSSAGSLLDVSGKIKATEIKGGSIGSYYRLYKAGTFVGPDRTDVTLECGTGDIMLSCQGHAGVSLDPKMQYMGSYFPDLSPTPCYASYLNKTGAQQQTWTQAICFNSDGSAIANQNGDVAQY